MRKKGHITVFLMGILIGLSSCGSTEKNGNIVAENTAVDITGSCEQSIYMNTVSNLVAAPSGYYSLSAIPSDDMYLTYIDKISAQEIYLCSKPECNHVDESGFFGLETCNSYVGCALLYSLAYHNGYVYVLTYDRLTYDVTLTRISEDGSIHEDIMVVGQAPNQGSHYSYAFADDNTIFIVYSEPDFIGKEHMVSLDRINLEKKEKTSVYSYTDVGADARCIKVYDEKVFFIQVQRQEESFTYQMMSYDIKSGETIQIIEDPIFAYTIADGGLLYYSVAADGLYCYDIKTAQSRLVRECDEETMYVTLGYDGTYLYLDNYTNSYYTGLENKYQIYVTSLEGEIVNIIPGGSLRVELTDADYIFNYSFSPAGWAYIQKEDITNPNVNWTLVKNLNNSNVEYYSNEIQ